MDRIQGQIQVEPTVEEGQEAADRIAQMTADAMPSPFQMDAPDLEGASPEDQAAAVQELAETARKALAAKRETFEAAVCEMVKSALATMQTARDQSSHRGGVYADYHQAKAAYENRRMPQLDATGAIIPNGEDSHLKAGTSLGLFTDAVNTFAAFMIRSTLGGGKRPFEFVVDGDKDENNVILAQAYDLTDDQLFQSKFRSEYSQAARDLPEHGTMALRQSWLETTEWIRDRDAQLREQTSYRGLSVRHWPVIDVFVGDLTQCRADAQRNIIWHSMKALADLEENERVWEIRDQFKPDPQTGQMTVVPAVYRRGRFINLERHRQKQVEKLQGSDGSYFDQDTQQSQINEVTSAQYTGVVNWQDSHDLYEMQGYLPMGTFIRSGKLDTQILQSYGVKMSAKGIDNPESLARLCDRLMWYVSVWDDTLVEFQICPYRTPRNELLLAQMLPGRFPAYGMGFRELAGDVEDAADQAHNSVLDVIMSNEREIIMGAPEDVKHCREQIDMINEGKQDRGFIELKTTATGVDPKGALAYFQRPLDANQIAYTDRLKSIYETRTMSTSMMKGGAANTESNTLGEASDQASFAENRQNEILMRLAEQIFVPLVHNLLEDMQTFMSTDELEEQVRRICGKRGKDFRALSARQHDLGGGAQARDYFDGVRVQTIYTLDIDKTVAIQFMAGQQAVLAANPDFDFKSYNKDLHRLIGIDAEKYWKNGQVIDSPEDIIEAIINGDFPNPNPAIGFQAILARYLPAFQQAIQWMIIQRDTFKAGGQPSDAYDGWIAALTKVSMRYADLAQQQMAQIQQMQMQAAMAGGGAPGGKPLKQDPNHGNPPNGDNAVKRGVKKKSEPTRPAKGSQA